MLIEYRGSPGCFWQMTNSGEGHEIFWSRQMSLVSIADLDKTRRQKDLRDTLARIKIKYLVMSGKGGVGKTTVAVNIAATLAATGARVGLLDIDLHGPSVAVALGLEKPLELSGDKLLPVISEYGLKVVTMQGLLRQPDEAVIWRGPKKVRAIRQFFSEVLWGDLDYLIIDSPPGTGDEPLTVLELLTDVRPLVVTSGSRLALSDAAKSLNFLKQLGRQVVGIVDNQSWLICPDCGQVTDIYDRNASQRLADKEGTPLLASLPLDLDVVQAVEIGRPLIWSNPDHSFSRAVAQLVVKLG